jgi:glycolate oxidase FAD binding subunit
VAAQHAKLAEIFGRTASSAIEVPAPDAWWRRVADATTPEVGASSLVLRIGTRPTDVVKALRVVEATRPTGTSLRAAADLPTGVLHVLLTPVDAPHVADLIGRARNGLGPLGGSCVVEHAPPLAKPGLDVWGDVGPALEPMRRLKRELDPASVLNPGRFVGGI